MLRHKSDHPTKNCTLEGCERPLRAKGRCATHYNKMYRPSRPNRHEKKLMPCAFCGAEVLRSTGGGRKYGATCSDQCRQWLVTPYCKLPADHWARWYGKTSNWKAPAIEPSLFVANTCDDCGTSFIESNPHNITANYSRYCSNRCARRVSRRARKAREHGAVGSFRWIDVIRIWVAGGKRCSYCDVVMVEQPDPDHVTPISRGGRNDLGNIVPCCHMCNADKCDLTLEEWAVERAKLGKPALRYVLPFSDPRFKHLTLDPAKGSAWRHALAA